jgi:hypothetical protein
MKKVEAKTADGRKFVINLYDTPPRADGSMTAAQYKSMLQEEKRYDELLDGMAREVSRLLDVAEAGEHAIDYWRAGKVMADHERELDKRAAATGAERRYEQRGRTRGRLEEKVKEFRQKKQSKRVEGNYFRKLVQFANWMTESQASRKVPYSLQHELLYAELTQADRDDFLDKCERGEIRTADALRAAVKSLLASRKGAAS